jgi:diguanylate cyclase (GGDEF)-like protein/PAS domain S-box-containing protein
MSDHAYRGDHWRPGPDGAPDGDSSVTRSREVFAALGGGVIVQGTDGRIIESNPMAQMILGMTASELEGAAAVDAGWRAVHEDGRPFALEELPGLVTLTTGRPTGTVVMGIDQGPGPMTWVLVDAHPERGPDGDLRAVSLLTDITALLDSNGDNPADDRYRLLSGRSPGVVVQSSIEGSVEWVSPSITEFVGWTAEDLVGRAFSDVVHPEDLPTVEAMQRDVRRGRVVRCEVRAQTASATYRWIVATARPVVDNKGVVIGQITAWQDADDVRGARLARWKAEEWLRLSLDALQESFFIFQAVRDDDGSVADLRYAFVNPAAERLYGLPVSQILGHGLLELFPSVADLGIFDCYTEPLRTGAPSSMRVPSFDENGVKGAFDVVASPFEDGVVVTARDVSDEVATERALAESQSRYRLMVENSPDMVALFDADNTISWVSQSVTDVLGWSPTDVIGHHVDEFCHPAEFPAGRSPSALRAVSRPATTRHRLRAQNGEYNWVESTVRPMLDDDGVSIGRVASVRNIQQQVEAEHALAASERRFRMLAESASDIVYQTDTDGVLQWISPAVADLLGWDPAVLAGRVIRELIHPDDLDRINGVRAQVYTGSSVRRIECRFQTASGDFRWMSVRAQPLRDDTGEIVGSVVGARDVHEEFVARQSLASSEELFRTAMQSAAIGMALTELDMSFRLVNPAFCRLLQRDEAWLRSHRLPDILHPDEEPSVRANRDSLWHGESESPSQVTNRRFVRADGATVWTRTAVVLIRDEEGEPDYFLAQVEDVTAEHDAEEALRYQAFHDALTGLRNRSWILDILQVDLRSAKRHGTSVGVLFVDLDNFKVVNDSLGHSAGDEVLAVVADRIAVALRPGDRVGRFGGDEFVVLVPDAGDPEEVERVAERISDAVAEPLEIQGHPIVPTASIGIAMSSSMSTPESLLRDTDAALFRAKEDGRARWRFFDDAMHARAVARLTLEAELRAAVVRDEFVTHYQPIVELPSGALAGYEALLRWNHPTRGLLAPEEFLAVAEDSGLIVRIGALALQHVCRTLAGDAGPTVPISVNVSAVELADLEWPARFQATLSSHAIEPAQIVVEVTETAVLSLLQPTRHGLAALRDLGVGIHVDDFGTGFSSISLLRDLPVTGVKLDASFVADLTTQHSRANALSRGLAGLVHGLHLRGIAEGIETAQQAAILHAEGWGHGQGYYYGRPEPETGYMPPRRNGHRAGRRR